MRPWTWMAAAAGLALGTPALAAPPAWVDGRDSRYSRDKFVIGVGKGPNRNSADLDARAEIARVFESKIKAVATDFQAAASKVNSAGKGVSVEVQELARFTEVTSKKTLSGTELRERATDGGTHYTLALLDRTRCVNDLEERIGALDAKIRGAMSAAEGGDKLKRFKGYGKALDLMDEREGLNAMLRVCHPKGKGVPAPASLEELTGAFDEAAGEFRLGIILEGNGSDKVRDCIMEALGDKGYPIVEIRVEDDEDEDEDDEDEDEDDEGKGFDAILKGKLKSQKAGEIAGSVMVKTDLTLKLLNGKTKKTLKTFTGSRKEGRRDVKASASLAAHKICLKSVPDIVAAIDKYFKR
jgi:hypothetical protein